MDAAEPELLRRELWTKYQFSVFLVTYFISGKISDLLLRTSFYSEISRFFLI